MNGKNPAGITSYDLLKGFALLLMVVDHIGVYFYPEVMWWRALGRMSAPVWFFLIGYSSRREVPALWLGGGLVLALADFMAGLPLLSLSVLFTLAAARRLMDFMLDLAGRGRAALFMLVALLLALSLHTNMILDYGTMGLLLALNGAFLRRGRRDLLLVSCLGYVAFTAATFSFAPPQMLLAAVGTGLVFCAMLFFSPCEFQARRLPGPARALIRFCGRHTLLLYVVHLLIFKAIYALSGDAGNPPFTLEFF